VMAEWAVDEKTRANTFDQRLRVPLAAPLKQSVGRLTQKERSDSISVSFHTSSLHAGCRLLRGV